MNARSRSRGFSLLEAVAALALLGLAVPAILSAFADAVSHAAQAEDRLNTLRRAQDLLTLATAQFHGEQGTRSGSDAEASWDVKVLVLERGGGEGLRGSIGLLPVQLTVTVRSRRGVEAHLETLFLLRKAS